MPRILRFTIVGVVLAATLLAACGESSGSQSSQGEAAYTHHKCVKQHNRNQYGGTDLQTGLYDPDVDAGRCTDILWEDGERIFNILPSEVLKLVKY